MQNEKGEISIGKAAFWASFSGYTGAIVGTPVSVIKTRMQAAAHPSIAVGRQHRYNGKQIDDNLMYSQQQSQ